MGCQHPCLGEQPIQQFPLGCPIILLQLMQQHLGPIRTAQSSRTELLGLDVASQLLPGAHLGVLLHNGAQKPTAPAAKGQRKE